MHQMNQLAKVDAIKDRVDKSVAGSIEVSRKTGLVVESMQQAMELAKLMSMSDKAIPAHLRGNPGACLAIAVQAYEWSINPFALANKSYCVSDRIAYESALYHAVVQQRAPIRGRIRMEYAGKDGTRTCRVWAELNDGTGTVEYTSPEFQRIKVKNSPLWSADPDQQLFYSSVRAFARRHFPDVMMGIYTVDELLDAPSDLVRGERTDKAQSAADRINAAITQKPVSEGQTFEPTPEAAAEAARVIDGAIQGEVVGEDGNETPDDPDVPPADQAEPDARETLYGLDADEFRAACRDGSKRAMQPMTDVDFASAYTAHLNLILGKGGAKWKTVSNEEKRELYAAFVEGRIGKDGKIAAKAAGN